MIAFEIMFLLILGTVAVVTIAAVGRPLAEAHAERLKAQYRELGSGEAANLRERITALEQEVLELRKQIGQIQETTEFTAKLLEDTQKNILRIEEKREV